jgi:hypothetical protein
VTTAEDVTLWLHIGTGFLALFAGAGALATKKGGGRHRRFGRAYLYSMGFVSATALVLYPLRPNFWRLFLGLVAVFSFYFAFSGYRVLSRKRPTDDPAPLDWGAVGLFGVASVGIVALGVSLFTSGNDFATVLLVFGAIGAVFAVTDLRGFRRESEPAEWVGQHVVRMGAGYIATVSAFSAVNFLFLPPVLRWLWPTLLGTPLLVYFQRVYEAKFAPASSDT